MPFKYGDHAGGLYADSEDIRAAQRAGFQVDHVGYGDFSAIRDGVRLYFCRVDDSPKNIEALAEAGWSDSARVGRPHRLDVEKPNSTVEERQAIADALYDELITHRK